MRDESSVWWDYLLTRDTGAYSARRLSGPRETALGYDIPVPVRIGARDGGRAEAVRHRGYWLAREVYLWVAYIQVRDGERESRVRLRGHLVFGAEEECEIVLSLLGVGRRYWRLLALAHALLEHRGREYAGGRVDIELVLGPPDETCHPYVARRWVLPDFVVDQAYGGVDRLVRAYEETRRACRLGLEPRYRFVFFAISLRWGPFEDTVLADIAEATCWSDSISPATLPEFCLRQAHPTFRGLDGLSGLFRNADDSDYQGLDSLGGLFAGDA